MICNNCGKENTENARFCGSCGNKIEISLNDPDIELLTRLLSPKFNIERKLGQGGMATVYLAEQTALERKVVIKILNVDLARDGEMRDRFLREARTSARLKHPHIMDVVDVGMAEDRPYFIMEHVAGGSVKDLLQKALQEGKAIDPLAAVRIMVPVLRGLHFAHELGVVHRDIKPDNILLRSETDPVIADFGIAKVAGGTVKTQTGFTMGTVSYMSPEQCQGHPVDGRSDVYSVGITLYEMIIGEVPFAADNAIAVVNKHISEAMPRLSKKMKSSSVSISTASFGPEVTRIRSLDAILEKACEKDPGKRYATAGEFANELGKLIGDRPESSSMGGAVKWGIIGSAAAVLIAALGFGGYRYWRSMHDNTFINSNPPGARVFNAITGEELGVTPFAYYDDHPGLEKYRLTLTDYREEVVEIELKDSNNPAPLKEINLATNLSLISDPPGATVVINGQEKGVTPRNIWLEPGQSYHIIVKKEGFVDVPVEIAVAGVEKVERSVQLFTPAQVQAAAAQQWSGAAPQQRSAGGNPAVRRGAIQNEDDTSSGTTGGGAIRRGAIQNE